MQAVTDSLPLLFQSYYLNAIIIVYKEVMV